LRFSFAMLASIGLPHGAVAIVEQGGQVGIGLYVDRASMSTIAAIRPALGLVLESGE
jgi:hypothetical protein